VKRNLAILLVTVALLAVQGALLRHPLARVDLATLVVLYLALERPVIGGAGMAAAVGYLADVFTGTDRGLHAVALLILFMVVRLVVARLAGGRFVFVTVVSVLGSLASVALVLAVEGLVGPDRSSFAAMAPALGPGLIGAAVLGYPCYRLLHALDARLTEPEDELVFR
jgi:rod shape-determining protein MreD